MTGMTLEEVRDGINALALMQDKLGNHKSSLKFVAMQLAIESAIDTIAGQNAEIEQLRHDIERETIRANTYEKAFGVAFHGTYQSHSNHWDRTGKSGEGCPECITATEVRHECQRIIDDGLQATIDAARMKHE